VALIAKALHGAFALGADLQADAAAGVTRGAARVRDHRNGAGNANVEEYPFALLLGDSLALCADDGRAENTEWTTLWRLRFARFRRMYVHSDGFPISVAVVRPLEAGFVLVLIPKTSRPASESMPKRGFVF
jgi:hypothetical protein